MIKNYNYNFRIRSFKYAGSKQHFVQKFIDLEKQIDIENSIFVEPFVGSGAIYCNNSLDYQSYIINDINEYVILVWKGFQNLDYEVFYNANKFCYNNFGDIKKDKKAYYKLRDFTNLQLNKCKTDLNMAPFIYLNMNSCINSMFRVGKKGLNQGWGTTNKGKLYFISEDEYNELKIKLNKTEILNIDYEELLIDSKEYFYFIDPPYYSSKTPGYSKYFSVDDHKKMTDILYNFKFAKYIYTDLLTEFNSKLKHERINILKNISPNRKYEQTKNEYMFTNLQINIKQTESWF